MPGKGRATGYTDFYKNTAKTPENAYGDVESEVNDYSTTSTAPSEKRKAAVRRRLMKLRTGK